MPDGSAATMESSPTVNRTDVYTALSHEYRQAIIDYFQDVDEGLTVSALATHIININSLSTGKSDRDLHRNIRGKLRHRHLPTLEKIGLVRFDNEQNVAYPTQALQTISA